MAEPIYLDYAAATPVDNAVLAAMQPFYQQLFYNPSANYQAAKQVQQALNNSRAQVAHWLGAKSSEIIFTAGGTEANNLAIQGVMQQFPNENCLVSSIEHESVLAPAQKHKLKLIPVLGDGRVDVSALKALIDDQTVLISVMYANNEIGTIQPIREVARIVEDVRLQRRKQANHVPLYLHCDACQAAQYLDLHVARLGVDLLTLNGGKIYGPKQSGVLFVKAGLVLDPLITGGGQERGLRSGTENVAQAVGLARALDQAQIRRLAEAKRLQVLQQIFYAQLSEQLPAAIINGSLKYRLPNNVHASIPGCDNERLLIGLDEIGIIAAAGSACSASDEEPSHVLRALGLDDTAAQASLRFTMGRQTTEAMIERTVSALAKLATG